LHHDYIVEGQAFRLRPYRKGDAEFTVALRTEPGNSKFLNSTSSSVEDQHSWFHTYISRQDDYYFVIERCSNHQAVGTIALYNVDAASAEWGRWVLQDGSSAAIESTLLLYRFAFDILQLVEIYCRTIQHNIQVVSFHNSCGLKQTENFDQTISLNGQNRRLTEHRLTKADWPQVEQKLSLLSSRLARKLRKPSEGEVL
jgi:RimJ/RimL family protein N-acetyltransferase